MCLEEVSYEPCIKPKTVWRYKYDMNKSTEKGYQDKFFLAIIYRKILEHIFIILTRCFRGPLFFSISRRAFFNGVGVLGADWRRARRDFGVRGWLLDSLGVEVWLGGLDEDGRGWTGVDWDTGIPPRTGVEVRLPSSKDMLGLLRNCEGLKGIVLTGDIFWGVVSRDSLGSWE